VQRFSIWNRLHTRETLLAEVQNAVFQNIAFFGDIAGAPYAEHGETICCMLTK